MTCKYAWENGYSIALGRIREFANRKAKEAQEMGENESGKVGWWRAQGQWDVINELMDEICDLISRDAQSEKQKHDAIDLALAENYQPEY